MENVNSKALQYAGGDGGAVQVRRPLTNCRWKRKLTKRASVFAFRNETVTVDDTQKAFNDGASDGRCSALAPSKLATALWVEKQPAITPLRRRPWKHANPWFALPPETFCASSKPGAPRQAVSNRIACSRLIGRCVFRAVKEACVD